MIRHEDPIHIAIIDYLKATLPHGWVIQHTPNKPRSKIAGAQEKRMGALAGWPDIAVYGKDPIYTPYPATFFLEVKAPKGRVSDNQHIVHDRLMDLGFPVAVVRSVDDVRACAKTWGWPSKDAALNDNKDPFVPLGDVASKVIAKAKQHMADGLPVNARSLGINPRAIGTNPRASRK